MFYSCRTHATCIRASLLLGTFVLITRSVQGITPLQQAEVHHKTAVEEVERGRFQRGEERFEQAFTFDPQHRFAWNAAMMHERVGSLDRAHLMYRHAARVATEAAQRAKDVAAIGLIEASLKRKGLVRVVTRTRPSTASVQIDGPSVEPVGDVRIRFAAPGAYSIEVVAAGFESHSVRLEVHPAVEHPVEIDLVPERVPPVAAAQPTPTAAAKDDPDVPPPQPPAGTWKRAGAIASGALGTVALAVGGTLMYVGRDETHDANQRYANDTGNPGYGRPMTRGSRSTTPGSGSARWASWRSRGRLGCG